MPSEIGCRDLYVATDHLPLLAILGEKSMADIDNKRLAKLKEKTMWWKFKRIYNPGKSQNVGDHRGHS
jgi:hypothetical protein